jgi:hypothetical protein
LADLQAAYDASLARARDGAVSIVARALPAFSLSNLRKKSFCDIAF